VKEKDAMQVGYARVSSAGQSLDIQREQLQAAGCERIFEEKRSGRSAADREALEDALGFVREGDTLVVTRLDRLARSITDLRQIVDGLTAKGVGFRCLQQGALDTTRSDGKLLLNILGSFAEFEADIRRERQMEGIAKAKERGVYRGRRPSIDSEGIAKALSEGESPTAVAKRFGVARSSVYRLGRVGDARLAVRRIVGS
jgi:DNA invertase Pin-like site-specific DNA recombinase